MSVFADALRWLSAEFSVSREEAQRHMGPMMAEGIVSRGYALQGKDGRLAVSDTGRRLLAAQEPQEDAECA